MTTRWTIGIDWDRDGELSGDDIVTELVGRAHAAGASD